MKINKRDFRHWLFLLFTGSLLLAFIPFRFFLKRKAGIHSVILYGHKLQGNLHSLYSHLSLSRNDSLSKYYYLTLDPFYYSDIKDNDNILLALNPLHLLKVVASDCIISDHGLHIFIILLKLTSIKFVDVWHGIPFKGFIPNDFKVLHQYDEIWVSSKLVKQLYQDKFGFSAEKVKVTGYGRTDSIIKYSNDKDSIKIKLGIPLNKKVILFAPTWKQDSTTRDEIPFGISSDEFISGLNSFAEKNNAFVLIRYHLNTSISTFTHLANIRFFPISSFPNGELIIGISDILITDWSSIAFDMMAINNPIIFLDVPHPFKNGFSLPPEYRVGDKVSSYDELFESLYRVCNDQQKYLSFYENDYRQVQAKVYDDTLDGNSAGRYLNRLESLLEI